MRKFTVAQRRARLAHRHHLVASSRAADAVAAAERLCGLHASDPASVFLSARARVDELKVADVEHALYVDKTLLRHFGMRRTLFALPTALVPVIQSACTDSIAANMRKKLVADLETGGVATNGLRWLRRVERDVIDALSSGDAAGTQLSRRVPALQTKLTYAPGKAYGGDIGITTRVLSLMSAEGVIARGRPNGTWTSSQHVWTLSPARPAALDADGALQSLAQRWLRAFGPATVDDLVWWTGVGATKVRKALTVLGAVEVDLDGAPGVALADDLDDERRADEWVAFLPALDPTTMGWKHRSWYLGDHARQLFDRNGNAGPTVWSSGRIVGGWSQRAGGEVVWQLLDDVGRDAARAIEREAQRVSDWLGATVVKPRFPTPLDLALRA